MSAVQRFFYTLCEVTIFLGVSGLVIPPSGLGRNSLPEHREDDFLSQGGGHRVDLCDHLLDLLGTAQGQDTQSVLNSLGVPDFLDLGRFIDKFKKCPSAGSSSGIAKGDFNGDGFADLAVGVPNEETPAGVPRSGAVIVIYGSANGLTTTDSSKPAPQFWSQNAAGVPGVSEAADTFGSALAAGDFNKDGFSDLAVGVPGEDIEGSTCDADTGRVVVIFGSPNGLTTTDTTRPAAQTFDLRNFLGDVCLGSEAFGSALAWGDFNGDGVGDLAIGAPGFGQVIDFGPSKGAVFIALSVEGGRGVGGLSLQKVFTLDDSGRGTGQEDDLFGAALAGGDFNGDQITDLAIGIPNREVPGTNTQGGGTIKDAGAVLVLFGSKRNNGLTTTGNRFFTETGLFFVAGESSFVSQAGDLFGSALAAGDFDGDGREDLAMGAHHRAIRGLAQAGGVFVQYSGSVTLAGRAEFWEQSKVFPGCNQTCELEQTGSTAESGDHFGWSLAAGDFNADGRDDLAIGAPFESVLVNRGNNTFENVSRAGEVDVLYGSTSGLSVTARPPQQWRRNSVAIQSGDAFGWSLTAWNFGRNESHQFCNTVGVCFTLPVVTTDLAIGAPFQSVGGVVGAGAVHVFYGSSSANGLTGTNSQIWTQASSNVPGGPEPDDNFGGALY